MQNGINGTVGEGFYTDDLWAELPEGLTEDQKKELSALRADKLQNVDEPHRLRYL